MWCWNSHTRSEADIFKYICLNKNICILHKISWTYDPGSITDGSVSTGSGNGLVLSGSKLLAKPMVTRAYDAIYGVRRPQWINFSLWSGYHFRNWHMIIIKIDSNDFLITCDFDDLGKTKLWFFTEIQNIHIASVRSIRFSHILACFEVKERCCFYGDVVTSRVKRIWWRHDICYFLLCRACRSLWCRKLNVDYYVIILCVNITNGIVKANGVINVYYLFFCFTYITNK